MLWRVSEVMLLSWNWIILSLSSKCVLGKKLYYHVVAKLHIANCAARPEMIGAQPVCQHRCEKCIQFHWSYKVFESLRFNLLKPEETLLSFPVPPLTVGYDILNHKHINYLCHKMTWVFSERLNLVWKVLITRKLISTFFPTSYGTFIQHVSRLTVTSAATPSVSLPLRKQEVCVVWR